MMAKAVGGIDEAAGEVRRSSRSSRGCREARESCPLLDVGPGGGVGVVGVRADHPGAAKPVELRENCMDHFTKL